MSRWARLKHVLACSCQAAAELSSRRLEERLSWTDALALRGHLLVCKSCRRFNRQLVQIRSWARAAAERFEDAAGGEETLSDEARARIARAVRDAAPR